MFGECKLIADERSPGVVRLERSCRGAGVSLVHCDQMEVVSERLERVDGRTRPGINCRVEPAWREEEQREPTADLLVVNGHAVRNEAAHNRRIELRPMSSWCSLADGRCSGGGFGPVRCFVRLL